MRQRLETIKTHIMDNKRIYVVGVSSLTLGILIGAACKNRPINIVNTVAPSFNNTVAPIMNNSSSSTVDLGGYARKLVRCNETGFIWESVKDAAEAMGVSSAMMSRHLNGAREHISDKTFSIIGLGTR